MQGFLAGGVTQEALATALGGAIDGVLSELVVLSEQDVVYVPPHLTDEDAVTLRRAYGCSWPCKHCIHSASSRACASNLCGLTRDVRGDERRYHATRVAPLDRKELYLEEVRDAYEYLSSGTRTGKVTIRI